MSLRDLSAPIAALALLTTGRDLPAARINITPIYPNKLEVSFHDDTEAFRTWLTALGITEDDVTASALPGNDSREVREATTSFGDTEIELTSFALANERS